MNKKRSALSPRLERIDLDHIVDSEIDRLEPHESYDSERFTAFDLSDRDLTGTAFTECEFRDLSADNADFLAASFVDTRLDGLNSPRFQAPRSRLRNVEINGSRLGSAEFYEARWQSVHLSDSKVSYINLRFAELTDVLFSDCIIDELDMRGAKANRVSFVNTTVNSLDFSESKLQNVDLRTLELRRISGGAESLKGVTMTPFQASELAPVFAEYFGITLIEDEASGQRGR
ncbi:MAG: pentapeptide repeat-containing protein [Gordonia sp. (in: high G+C Gram-positive bacteria)]|uniref:pentapeptide repeat-containing protein n=1 Tax=Gordonia sp. (in: high G+C Gram-positive bacteria) TaxID=84139 RepID=UPI003C745B51